MNETKPNDGGCAFPCSGFEQWAPEPGMLLRDAFAMAALIGFIAHKGSAVDDSDQPFGHQLLGTCYMLADAAMKVRSPKETKRLKRCPSNYSRNP